MIAEFAQKIAEYIEQSSECWFSEVLTEFTIGENIMRVSFTCSVGSNKLTGCDECPSYEYEYTFICSEAEIDEKPLNNKELKQLDKEVNYNLN